MIRTRKASFKFTTRYLSMLWLLLSACITLSAQQTSYTIKGTVYDETGETLPAVTIYLKNKIGVGTSTDVNGNFSIRASRNDVIVFSFVGYESVEYLVAEEKQDVEIRFSDAAQELEEVVVQALGTTQRRISSLAAVTSVDVKELQQPVASVANLLGGRVAGIMSLQTSGEPGKNISEFWVRGIGTFGANSSALVLIDGLEGDINTLDAADIESFSVLKDAAATAVYGVRGANGVVLVTTKRGQAGKLFITGRANVSLSHLRRMPEYLGAYDYAKLVNEAMVLRNEKPLYSEVELAIIQDALDPDMYPDVNWQKEIMRRTSFRQNYYVSAKGGAEVARYFLSLGGSKDDAAYKYDKGSAYSSNVGYSTYNYRANIDLELSPSTELYFGTDGFLSITNYPGVANTEYIWAAQSQINPLNLPKRYSNRQFPAAGTDVLVAPTVMINQYGRRSSQEYRGKATMALNQDLGMLVEGLKIRAQGAYDLNSFFTEARLINPPLYEAVGRDARGALITILRVPEEKASYARGTNQYRKYHFESTLNYERVFGTDHRVSGLIYYFITDSKKTQDSNSNLSAIPVRYQGVSSKIAYGFRDTYMIDLNFGYNGSENFQPGRQYGFFPSIAVGWVPSSYNFVRDNAPWVNLFKIRASYGIVGNDRIIENRRFPYLTTVTTGNVSPWGSTAILGAGESAIGADNLMWEKSAKLDVGIEGKFLKNRLEFVVDFFNDQRDGIFMERVQVPDYAGLLTMPYGNVGRMRSYGSDGNISYIFEINADMHLIARGNYTYSKNSVQDWEEANPKYPYQEAGGYPHGTIRGYRSLGLFRDQYDVDTSPIQTLGTVMPGDIKYRDINGDGKIDSSDQVPLSYSTYPLLMYGFGGEFRYKQFTLGVMFKGTGKTDYYHVGQEVEHNNMRYPNGMGYVPFFDGKYGNVLTKVNDPKNRWIPKEYAAAQGLDPSLAENPDAMFPRLQYGKNNNNAQLSDFWKGDARYLRLQEITLNYNLRNDFLRKIKIQSIDLQFVGSNLHVWDKVKTFDPEQAHFNGMVYPIPTTYTLQVYINM